MTPPTVTVDAEGTVTGNTYDKYGSTNPVVRRLMSTFERTLGELWTRADPQSVLDVGCGEGVLTHQWAQALGDRRIVGIDLEDPHLQAEWATRQRPNLEYRVTKAERDAVRGRRVRPGQRDRGPRARAGPRAHGGRDGARRLALAARVRAARAALARAEPRRAAPTCATSATRPGTSTTGAGARFVALLGRHGEVVEARSPFPWTMLLVRVGD